MPKQLLILQISHNPELDAAQEGWQQLNNRYCNEYSLDGENGADSHEENDFEFDYEIGVPREVVIMNRSYRTEHLITDAESSHNYFPIPQDVGSYEERRAAGGYASSCCSTVKAWIPTFGKVTFVGAAIFTANLLLGDGKIFNPRRDIGEIGWNLLKNTNDGHDINIEKYISGLLEDQYKAGWQIEFNRISALCPETFSIDTTNKKEKRNACADALLNAIKPEIEAISKEREEIEEKLKKLLKEQKAKLVDLKTTVVENNKKFGEKFGLNEKILAVFASLDGALAKYKLTTAITAKKILENFPVGETNIPENIRAVEKFKTTQTALIDKFEDGKLVYNKEIDTIDEQKKILDKRGERCSKVKGFIIELESLK